MSQKLASAGKLDTQANMCTCCVLPFSGAVARASCNHTFYCRLLGSTICIACLAMAVCCYAGFGFWTFGAIISFESSALVSDVCHAGRSGRRPGTYSDREALTTALMLSSPVGPIRTPRNQRGESHWHQSPHCSGPMMKIPGLLIMTPLPRLRMATWPSIFSLRPFCPMLVDFVDIAPPT